MSDDKATRHRITSSARSSSSDCGIVSPSAFAVFRLIRRPRKRSFAQVLAAMPDGRDADFERRNAAIEAPRVFD